MVLQCQIGGKFLHPSHYYRCKPFFFQGSNDLYATASDLDIEIQSSRRFNNQPTKQNQLTHAEVYLDIKES